MNPVLKYFVLDLLACPVCKSTNLKLHVIEEEEEDTGLDPGKVKCRSYCHYLGKPAGEVSIEECRVCVKKRIKTGVIVCRDCGRWYPIIETIAVMLDDEYRDERIDKRFVKEYLDRIPEEVKGLMKIPDLNKLQGQ